MKMKYILCLIATAFILSSCTPASSIDISPSIDSMTSESEILESTTQTQEPETENEGFAFVSYGAEYVYGATYLNTIQNVLDAINTKAAFASLFYRDISPELMNSSEVTYNPNILQYTYGESKTDAFEIFVDKTSGNILSAGWIINLNSYDLKDEEDSAAILEHSSAFLALITQKGAYHLPESYYTNHISSFLNSPVKKDSDYRYLSLEEGVGFSITISDSNYLYISTTAVADGFENNWKAMPRLEASDNTIDIQPNYLQLNELDIKAIIDPQGPQTNLSKDYEYQVGFDNQAFTISTKVKRNTWVSLDYKKLALIDEHVVAFGSAETINKKIIYTITIWGLSDYHFTYPTDAYELTLTLQCETDPLYKYNLEKCEELNSFILNIMKEIKTQHPLHKELVPAPLTDLSNFEFLFYCAATQESYWETHRVTFNGETFELTIKATGYDTYFISEEDIKIYSKGEAIAVYDDGDDLTEEINRTRVEVFLLDSTNPHDAPPVYHMELYLECLSNREFNKGIKECPDYLNFIKELVNAMAN